MNLLFWGLTVSVVGKILLVIGVVRVHTQIVHEHKIDSKVLKSIKSEHTLTVIGLILIIIGYLMEVYFYGFATPMLTCSGEECMALLTGALSQ